MKSFLIFSSFVFSLNSFALNMSSLIGGDGGNRPVVVGFSDNLFTGGSGGNLGGFGGANKSCQRTFGAGTHFCSVDEVRRSGAVPNEGAFTGVTTGAWVDVDIAPKRQFIDQASSKRYYFNDSPCNGWTSAATNSTGGNVSGVSLKISSSRIFFDAYDDCSNTTYKIACCR